MGIVQIVAVGLIATILAITLKNQAPEFAISISIASCVLIFLMVMPRLAEIVSMIARMADQVDTDMAYILIVLKIVGIAYIAEFGAQVCMDAGESAIASKIEMGGKVLIMTVSAPILLSLVDMIMTMLPG